MQPRIAQAERLQRSDRRDDVVRIGARYAVTLADQVQLLLDVEASGILNMPAIDDVADRAHARRLMTEKRHRPDIFKIDLGRLFACA